MLLRVSLLWDSQPTHRLRVSSPNNRSRVFGRSGDCGSICLARLTLTHAFSVHSMACGTKISRKPNHFSTLGITSRIRATSCHGSTFHYYSEKEWKVDPSHKFITQLEESHTLSMVWGNMGVAHPHNQDVSILPGPDAVHTTRIP